MNRSDDLLLVVPITLSSEEPVKCAVRSTYRVRLLSDAALYVLLKE